MLDAYAGFDPRDELTAFSVGRRPSQPYQSFAHEERLDGVRIGVVREYMDRDLFTIADAETIDIVERAIEDLRALGATVIDPGPQGTLFQDAVDKYSPVWRNQLFVHQFSEQFAEGSDHLPPPGGHVLRSVARTARFGRAAEHAKPGPGPWRCRRDPVQHERLS